MKPKKVLQYQTSNGRVPFRKWLLSLKDLEARARVRTRIDRLHLGNVGDCKGIGEGIYELRIFFGPGYRVYFGERDREIVVLLCGGSKSSQHKDIAKALEYWRDYKRRRDEGS